MYRLLTQKQNIKKSSKGQAETARLQLVDSELTFGLGQPYEKDVGVVNDADDPSDKDDEDVANDDLGSERYPAWHDG